MQEAGTLEVSARGDREIVMNRLFNAPRSLVFDCWTKPELLSRWYGGPDGWTLIVCEVDLRPGGAYRFVAHDTEGTEMGWGGSYQEVVPPERLVATEVFDEHWYPGEALITTVVEEQDGNTLFTTTLLYESRDARDAVLQSPMESGFGASLDKLDALLQTIA
jgi:uncharacterized protein YndB with AHSA1/START domain